MKEKIRRCLFRPYLSGPRFILTLYDINRAVNGRWYVGYSLTMRENKKSTVIFTGEDFSPGPLHAIDSDAAVAGLMGFLTLRPGDTDKEYFATYTPEQITFCEQHAEALSYEVSHRFGDD